MEKNKFFLLHISKLNRNFIGNVTVYMLRPRGAKCLTGSSCMLH